MDPYHRRLIVLLCVCNCLSGITIATVHHLNNLHSMNPRILSSNDVHTGPTTFQIDYENDTFEMDGKPFR